MLIIIVNVLLLFRKNELFFATIYVHVLIKPVIDSTEAT